MAKAKSVFFCTECGNETPKWAGRCPSCGAWNTLVEQAVGDGAKAKTGGRSRALRAKAHPIAELDTAQEIRFPTGMGELDRVLGGGAVQGSLVLVGGAPGIGKSTLMLQICGKLSENAKILYVSGEESRVSSSCAPTVSACSRTTCTCCPRPASVMCWNPSKKKSPTF